MDRILFALVLSLTVPAQAHSELRSYQEVKQKLDSTRLNTLPARPTVGPVMILNALIEAKTHTLDELRAIVKPGSLIDRILKTFSNNEDFKDDNRAKYIHSMGACAIAEWKIDRASSLKTGALTGLFAPTTHPVRGIGRLSVAVDQAKYKPGEKRAWGFALKLFPGNDENQAVATRNLLFFDRYGLDGSDRPLALAPASGDLSVQFINFINETGKTSLKSRIISTLFSFFDILATYRPLDHFADVDSENREVARPNVPTFLVLRQRPIPELQKNSVARGFDFRDELKSYPANHVIFDIFVSGSSDEDLAVIDTRAMTQKALRIHQRLDNVSTEGSPLPIGTLTLGDFQVSSDCDLTLHFAHDANHQH